MYENIFQLTGRVIIVTGGAGHLGRSICEGLAAFGAHAVAVGRNEDRLRALRDTSRPGASGSVECRVCDVNDVRAFTDVAEHVFKEHGRIDGLVNNAHAAGREKWEELDKAGWLAGLEGTLNHYFTCTKIVGEYLLKAGSGAVANNASLFSFLVPNAKMHLDLNNMPPVHYAAAKGAVLQMTRYLAALWGERGVRVNAFSPGWFPQKRGPDRPDYLRELTSRIPMARIGQSADLVGTVVFLLSDASAYVTGQNLVVDGGYSLW